MYSSIVVLLEVEDANLGISLVFTTIVNFQLFICQAYFALELKRVRIWLESKNPLELEMALAKHTKHQIIMYTVLSVGCVITIGQNSIEPIFPPDMPGGLIMNAFADLSRIFCNGYLIIYTCIQVKYFIERRSTYRKNAGLKQTWFEKASIYYIALILAFFVILEVSLIIYFIVNLSVYATAI